MKLYLLACACATYVHADAHSVLPALAGTWDVFTKGHHVADVNVQGGPAGTVADFDDGHGDGDQYQLSVKHGLLEMNGWVARTERDPKAILWHRDNEEVMWRRQAKKLRGNSQTLEQSKSGLSRTRLPSDDADSTSPFADLIAQSEAARKHADATLAKAKDAPTAAKAEPAETEPKAPKEAEAEPVATAHTPTSSFDPAAHTAEPPANASMVEAAHPKKVSKAPRKAFVPQSLSQDVMERYLVPLKVAQSQEKNSTMKHGVHERKKTFPAAMHSLAALMTNTQRGIDATVFDTVIEEVRTIIRDEAAATCQDIETTFSTNADAVGECSTLHTYASGTEGTSAAYDTADSEYTTASGEYDDAVSTETTECTERDTACSNRDAKGLDLYNEVAASQYCPETTPEAELTFDDTFVLADVDTWANTILTKHTAWDTAKIECTTEEQECSDAETVTAEKETVKSEKCTALETAATNGLSAYDGCYNTAFGAYSGYDPTATLDSIKNSIEAVETLMCYIDVAMEGLSGDDASARTKNTDAQTSCSMDPTTEEYICDCSDGTGSRYTESYSLAVNAATPPDRDGSWDALGCPDAGGPTTTAAPVMAQEEAHHYRGEKTAVEVHAKVSAEKKESKAPTLSKKHAIVRSAKSAEPHEPKHNEETL